MFAAVASLVREVVFASMVGQIPVVNDLLMLPCICLHLLQLVKLAHVSTWHHNIVFAAVVGHGGVVQCFVDALLNVVSLSEGSPLINVIFFWLPFVDAFHDGCDPLVDLILFEPQLLVSCEPQFTRTVAAVRNMAD
ncbi:hypothetical protein Tco_0967782 [Tanacetum coccineum]